MTDIDSPRWQNLLAQSASTFTAEAAPYGLATRVLAQVRAERQQHELVERIGWRALFASAALLLLTGAGAGAAAYLDRGDLEPGLSNIAQTSDIPFA